LRRRHKGRTPEGERLLEQLHAFRRTLRRLLSTGGDEAVAEHLPYAVVFGLDAAPSSDVDQLPQVSTRRPELIQFASAFSTHCSSLVDWKRPPGERRSYDMDTWSHNPWGGIPRGGEHFL
jgi:hypothetical protein